VTGGWSLPNRAASASTAWLGGATAGGGATGGTAAAAGWVNVGGRLGIDAGPEGGARFIAGPAGGSGTGAGGIGGGRSLNNWADAARGKTETRIVTSKTAKRARPALLDPVSPCLAMVMGMLFTENAANSSLMVEWGLGVGTGRDQRRLARQAGGVTMFSVKCGINHACCPFWRVQAWACSLVRSFGDRLTCWIV